MVWSRLTAGHNNAISRGHLNGGVATLDANAHPLSKVSLSNVDQYLIAEHVTNISMQMPMQIHSLISLRLSRLAGESEAK